MPKENEFNSQSLIDMVNTVDVPQEPKEPEPQEPEPKEPTEPTEPNREEEGEEGESEEEEEEESGDEGGTEEKKDPEIEGLKEQVSILTSNLDKALQVIQQQAKPQKKEEESKEPQVAEYISSDEQLQEIVSSKETFNKFLSQFAQSITQGTLRSLPSIVDKAVTSKTAAHQIVTEFFTENNDLVPYRGYIAYKMTALMSEHPDWEYKTVLGKAAESVRLEHKLVKQVKGSQKKQKGSPGFAPTPKHKQKPNSAKDKALTFNQKKLKETLI